MQLLLVEGQGEDLDGKQDKLLLGGCNYGHFSIMGE